MEGNDMIKEQINELINKYCGNDMKLLKKICYPIMIKFGGLSESDYDDFYSIANITVWKAADVYDETDGTSFETFLIGCLIKKFKTEMTRRNTQKRKSESVPVSIEMVITPDSDKTFADVIDSGFDIYKEIDGLNQSEGLMKFMSGLSKKQKRMADLICDGYRKEDILRILSIDERRYNICLENMKTFDNYILLKIND